MSTIDLELLQEVNTRINAIPYVAIPKVSEEYDLWIDKPTDTNTWECRDYVLAKANELKSLDKNLLSVVLCYTETDEYHAVLKVADYILDSRCPLIYLWRNPTFNYHWAQQQIPGTLDYRIIPDNQLV